MVKGCQSIFEANIAVNGMAKHGAYMRCWQSKAEHGNVLIRDHLAAIHPAFQPKEEVRKAKIKRKDQIFIYILLKLNVQS